MLDIKPVKNQLVEILFSQDDRHLVDGKVDVLLFNHTFESNVTEESDLASILLGNGPFGTTNQHVGEDPDLAEPTNRVLCGLGLDLT